MIPVFGNGFTIKQRRMAPEAAPLPAGSADAGTDPLANNRSLQFRDGAENDGNGTAQRSLRIEGLAKADELDAKFIEFIEQADEVGDGTGQAVKGPDSEHIEVATAGVGQQVIESGSVGLGPADTVIGIFAYDHQTTLLGQATKVLQLAFG